MTIKGNKLSMKEVVQLSIWIEAEKRTFGQSRTSTISARATKFLKFTVTVPNLKSLATAAGVVLPEDAKALAKKEKKEESEATAAAANAILNTSTHPCTSNERWLARVIQDILDGEIISPLRRSMIDNMATSGRRKKRVQK